MKKLVLIVALCAFVATPAMADLGTVYMKYNGVGPYLSGTIYAPFVGTVGGVETGIYHMLVDESNPQTTYHGIPSWGFCTEMSYSNSGWYAYSVLEVEDGPLNNGPSGSPMGDVKADYVRELWAMVGPSATMSVDEAAALQAAIWEIVYEDHGWDVRTRDGSDTDHSFAISQLSGDSDDSVRQQANDWLKMLDGQGPMAQLVIVSYPGIQDYIVQVPVPGAVLLGLLGLGTAGARLRRRSA